MRKDERRTNSVEEGGAVDRGRGKSGPGSRSRMVKGVVELGNYNRIVSFDGTGAEGKESKRDIRCCLDVI
jgi:hypothetical protein